MNNKGRGKKERMKEGREGGRKRVRKEDIWLFSHPERILKGLSAI